MRPALLFVISLLSFSSWCIRDESPASHRSPIEIALLSDGRALTANHTADSISLIDLSHGTVLAEARCGQKPSAIACSPDGKRAAISNLLSGTVTLFQIDKASLQPCGEIAVGPMPRGLVFAQDGGTFFVAIADEVVQCDWNTCKLTHRFSAPREPRHLALSPNGRWLAAASSRSATVHCWDVRSGKPLWERRIEDAFNMRGLAFTPDGKAVICAHVVHREFPVSKENIEKGWVIDSRLTRLVLDPEAQPPLEQIALDTHGQAVGDPDGVCFTKAGRWLAVTASGTHELLLLEAAHVPWTGGDPGDLIDPALKDGEHRMRRVPLGGRPMTVVPLDGSRLAVVNYLLDAVQIVDAAAGKVIQTIPLGAPERRSLARQGEALFYDATRSHNQWFSCNTCHTEGHTCGLTFDTLNDDSYGNAKLTPTLRNVTKTGPWTWHGWQKDLAAGVKKSLTETMFGPQPTSDDSRALVAFLATLDHPPNPNNPSDATRRGEALFRGKAKCARCHKGDHYTSDWVYDVGLESDGSPHHLWNPPSLRGVWDRGPYLHDGRAKTLEELLRRHHTPAKLGGEALTDDERKDLLAFLRAL
jgi:cytochrome c peroxidase